MKFFIAGMATVVAALALSACGGSNSAPVASDSVCQSGGAKRTVIKANGRTIVRAEGDDCVIADNGATVIARGQAIVSAHGDSVVDAGDSVTIVVYNDDVRCNIRSSTVTVINAVKSSWTSGSLPNVSCRIKPR